MPLDFIMFEVFYYNLEITTLGNISYTGSSPPTEVTLLPNVTGQSTELTTTEQTITTDLAETKETTQNVLTSILTILSTSVSLTTTVVTIETTETSTEKSTSSSPTTTALRTTKGQWKILMDKLTYLSKASVLTRIK